MVLWWHISWIAPFVDSRWAHPPHQGENHQEHLCCNDSDWVEICAVLGEHHDGRLKISHWAYTVAKAAYSALPIPAADPVSIA
jgi:hypothetical protein